MEKVQIDESRFVTQLTIAPVIHESRAVRDNGDIEHLFWMNLPGTEQRITVGSLLSSEIADKEEIAIDRIRKEAVLAIARHLSAPWEDGGQAWALRNMAKEAA